jgi:hypothetical protein
MDKVYISIIITALVSWWLFMPSQHNTTNTYCRSHDSFMFKCHHAETDTETYLRRVIAKLDQILEQIKTTPSDISQIDSLEKKSVASRISVSCTIDQLQLLKTGKVTTGILAWITPKSLLNHESKEFDRLDDVKIRLPAEELYYTNEEAKSLEYKTIGRNTLWTKKTCMDHCLFIIKMDLLEVIQYCLRYYKIKSYLDTPGLYNWANQLKEDTATIMKAISNGIISNMNQLEVFILNHYKQKELQTTPATQQI